MALLQLHTDDEHAAAIFAYTQEAAYDLYGKLNQSCRTTGVIHERRLALYLDYLHVLIEATTTLPNLAGVVYRGIDCKLNPASYVVGTTITWQQFSSTSKKQQQARKFVTCDGGRLAGSLLVLHVRTGKEIEIFSEFPEEEEVLLGANSFFRVESKLEGADEKRALLADLAAYDMTDLDVYVMRQR